MITTARETMIEAVRGEPASEIEYERWKHWPIHWSGIWVGVLAAFAAAVIIGLIALAVGAHMLRPEHRVVDLRKISLVAAAFGIFGTFLAFVIGGWVAGKIAGILRSEPAMLHGAIVWLLALPLFVLGVGTGAGGYAGSWYAGLKTNPQTAAPYEKPEALAPTATAQERTENAAAWAEYRANVARWQEETPRATRNAALLSVTALLLGLMGSVIGGWMASGEPMTFRHSRNRTESAGG